MPHSTPACPVQDLVGAAEVYEILARGLAMKKMYLARSPATAQVYRSKQRTVWQAIPD